MTDLTTLAAELLPGATWVGAGGVTGETAARDRDIAWVRVLRARVPAFDALEPGDLVIAPASVLAVVAPGDHELRELVAGLAAVPVSGVLFVEAEPGATGGPSLDAAAAAVRAAGLPALRVTRTDAMALERSVVGYIVARGAELERQAALLETELRRRALDGAGAAGLVVVVSSFLGRALALEAGRGQPVVVHAPADVPSAAADAARYQSARRAAPGGVALRVPLPSAEGAAGALLVLGAAPASELARVTLPRVAGLVALELAREEAIRGAADRARRSDQMPAAGPPWVVLVASQREAGTEADSAAARNAREATRRAIRLLAPARRMSLRGDADSLEIRLVIGGGDDEATRLAERIGALLGRPVARSRTFMSSAERPAAEGEARATLEAALALPRPARLASADRLAIYRMLGALHRLPDGQRLAREVLQPLLDARPDVRRERVETLRAVLARGSVAEAAAALGVHRNTVAYRVRRIEAATGWRLADPELRLPLAAALALIEDDQA